MLRAINLNALLEQLASAITTPELECFGEVRDGIAAARCSPFGLALPGDDGL
jgi:hypothetical protein